jgi:signal transduction histidine kinase
MTKETRFWLAGGGLLLAAQVVLLLTISDRFVLAVASNGVQLFLLLFCTSCLLRRIRNTSGQTRLFWGLMATGFSIWLTYQAIWTYFEVVLRQATPNPFVGDVLVFIHIVPMMAAIGLQPHREADVHGVRIGRLDFVLLLIYWVYLYMLAVIPWQYVSFDEQIYGSSFNALYLTEKLVFLGGLGIVWWRGRGDWRRLYAQWFGATALYGAGAYIANLAIDRHAYYTGSLYDLPLVASMVWFGAILRQPLHLESQAAVPGAARQHGLWEARLAMGAMLSLPLLATWAAMAPAPAAVQRYRLLLTLGTILLLGTLVFLKQHMLDRELLRSLQATEASYNDLQRVQAQLLQSEKLASLGQLVGGAAHELNNPLTAVLGYVELLHSTQPLTEEQRGLADKILSQVKRTKALVASLLSFAQQTPGRKARLDLNALLRTAIKQVQPQLRTRGVDVRTNLAVTTAYVLGDQNQLLQVFLQILLNAQQAMEGVAGGTVHISTRMERDIAIAEFADTGPGAQHPERVFDPFYTTKAIGKGAGLGLSACYGIIGEHSGKIFCRNRKEGGAMFRIELPLAPSRPADLVAPPAEAESVAQASIAPRLQ